MVVEAWVLREPLKLLESADEPYLSTASGSVDGHEVAVHYAPAGAREFRIFLDGQRIFELGMAAPEPAWFRFCREMGYDPETHWDLDGALILFRQVVPALAREWKENALPYTEEGVPEGVVSLAALQSTWAEGVRALRARARNAADELVASCFARLPLRTLTFHDDPRQREDFVGNALDAPFLGVFARLGSSQSKRVTLSKATLHATGGMKWSPWKIGGDWKEGERDFLSTRGPVSFVEAAGLDAELPPGFREAFTAGLDHLLKLLDPAVEAYREAHPVGVPWHRDRRNRYMNHMIVDVRLGDHTVLVLDDGTEVRVAEGD